MVALATGNECPMSLTPISAGGWAAPDRVLAVMTASALETDFPRRTSVAADRSGGCRIVLAGRHLAGVDARFIHLGAAAVAVLGVVCLRSVVSLIVRSDAPFASSIWHV
jgi:hypothetical protein